MNKLIILFAAVALPVGAQTVECVEVPKDHKLVAVPWFVPAKELMWKWKPAKEIEKEEVECDELAVSPALCEED